MHFVESIRRVTPSKFSFIVNQRYRIVGIQCSYGMENIHLVHAVQYGPSTIRLNVKADEPILPAIDNNRQARFNYTALLTGQLDNISLDFYG
jgi:hypothetical protein